MDDETKDYSELKLGNYNGDDEVIDNDTLDNEVVDDDVLDEESLDDEVIDEDTMYGETIEVSEEKLVTVKEQLQEIKEHEINNKIDEIKEVQKNNKKLNKTLIILLAVLFVLILLLVGYLLFFKKEDKQAPTPIDNNKTVINRPSDDLEYIILKQNQITLNCNKTKDGEKITSLKKGLVIECNFEVNSSQNINELYFDLDNSSNLKMKEYTNTSEHELINDKKAYKLTSNNSFNKIENNIKFYYEVIDTTEKTGYVEIENIVFKDNKNNYYKMINNIVAFPPEYNDKIYIYKQSIDKETSYVGSKTLLNDKQYLELVDTFKCSSEECEVKDNNSNYFVIYDNGLTVYDVLLRTKQKVKITDSKFNYDNYGYELILNKDNEVLGVLFKKNYVDNTDCDENLNICIENSISGYEVSYYSMSKNMFTIALDYGFVGANVYTDYDEALILEKDNKFGIFSYEEDDMVLNLSKKYVSIEYDAEVDLVKLGLYDSKNKQNYYTYYNLKTTSFKINTKAEYIKKINSSNIYYINETNKQGNSIYMLYNSKGEVFKDLPYVLSNQIELANNESLIIKNDGIYDIYDINGNFIETSQYIQSGLKVLKTTTSYTLSLNKDNNLIVTDKKGNTIGTLIPRNDINEVFDIDTMNIIKCEENNQELEIIIENPNITIEGKNAYKFNVNKTGVTNFEYINYEN